MIFLDRSDAGIRLASRLTAYRDRDNVLVLALPRGGVVVGEELAKALRCPLDVIIIRKIGCPGQPELAAGAISETGTVVRNEAIIALGVPESYLEREIARQKGEIERRKALYRGGGGIPPLAGMTVILTDDGVATGATVKAAIASLKRENISRLVVAMPVASVEAAREIGRTADEWVCLETPDDFMAVGDYYRDFTQVSDDEVVEILGLKGPGKG